MSNEKHFIDEPAQIVLQGLTGLVQRTPGLKLDAGARVVYRQHTKPCVALISGGGSGHEPAHAGFVGDGILSAAVCGAVFASPNASQIRRGIELVDNEKGIVLVVKNYTGDVLNFGLAKERYAAEHPSTDKLRMIVVGDDVSVGKTQSTIVGRRGLAGTTLVYKIAGALAEQGAPLDDVHETAEYVASRVATIGVGAEHVHVPGAGPGSATLDKEELEIGMGIHNEPGVRRQRQSLLSPLITQLVELLTDTFDPERSYLPFKHDGQDEVVLMVNNLGATSELELGGITEASIRELFHKGIRVKRVLVGTYMTSLNMLGFSLTLLLLPRPDEGSVVATDHILELLDAPSSVAAFRPATALNVDYEASRPPAGGPESKHSTHQVMSAPHPEHFVSALKRACDALISAEPDITRMDTVAGDGDCGTTLKSGAEGVLHEIYQGSITGSDVGADVLTLARVAEEKMGGTSGALYSIFLSALAASLSSSPSTSATAEVWAHAASAALEKLYTYTRARPPSRTLVDPLAAFVSALVAAPSDISGAAKVAGEAAEKTQELEAKAGRAAYVEGERLKEEQVPDPGAWGVKVILEALLA